MQASSLDGMRSPMQGAFLIRISTPPADRRARPCAWESILQRAPQMPSVRRQRYGGHVRTRQYQPACRQFVWIFLLGALDSGRSWDWRPTGGRIVSSCSRYGHRLQATVPGTLNLRELEPRWRVAQTDDGLWRVTNPVYSTTRFVPSLNSALQKFINTPTRIPLAFMYAISCA